MVADFGMGKLLDRGVSDEYFMECQQQAFERRGLRITNVEAQYTLTEEGTCSK